MQQKTILTIALAVMLAFPLSGCGGRAAQRVQIVQEKDRTMSCEELDMEIANVAEQYRQKQDEADEEEDRNTAMIVGSAIPFVGLAAAANMDAKRGALKESLALRDRLDRLERMADRRCEEQKQE